MTSNPDATGLPAAAPEALDALEARKRAAARGRQSQPIALAGPKPSARDGTVTIAGHFAPELRRALKKVAVDHDMSLAQVMEEAFAMYLKTKGIDWPAAGAR